MRHSILKSNFIYFIYESIRIWASFPTHASRWLLLSYMTDDWVLLKQNFEDGCRSAAVDRDESISATALVQKHQDYKTLNNLWPFID